MVHFVYVVHSLVDVKQRCLTVLRAVKHAVICAATLQYVAAHLHGVI